MQSSAHLILAKIPSSLKEQEKANYEEYVKTITPTHSLPVQMGRAFLTGGVICLIGQLLLHFLKWTGMDQQTAASWCSLILVFFSALLTGLNLYPGIVKWGGRRRPGPHHRLCQFRSRPCY